MILVGQYDSPFVRRVAVTLHHYGIAFERNPISVFTNVAQMAAINPLVRIPSLVLDDGEVLIDSAAILDHLDEVVGSATALTPRSGAARRRALQIIALASGAVDKAGAQVYERHFHAPQAVNEAWVARCREQMRGAVAQLEAKLDGSWFVADRFGQADVTTAVMIGYLKLRLPDIHVARDYPRLAGLSARCEAMACFVQARPGADEIMPSQ